MNEQILRQLTGIARSVVRMDTIIADALAANDAGLSAERRALVITRCLTQQQNINRQIADIVLALSIILAEDIHGAGSIREVGGNRGGEGK